LLTRALGHVAADKRGIGYIRRFVSCFHLHDVMHHCKKCTSYICIHIYYKIQVVKNEREGSTERMYMRSKLRI
jgi:hypothetical protein